MYRPPVSGASTALWRVHGPRVNVRFRSRIRGYNATRVWRKRWSVCPRRRFRVPRPRTASSSARLPSSRTRGRRSVAGSASCATSSCPPGSRIRSGSKCRSRSAHRNACAGRSSRGPTCCSCGVATGWCSGASTRRPVPTSRWRSFRPEPPTCLRRISASRRTCGAPSTSRCTGAAGASTWAASTASTSP